MTPLQIVLAAAGTLATFTGIIIKVRNDRKRELLKCAIDTAHKDFEANLKIALERNGDARPFPMSTYIGYHHNFLKLIDKGVSSEDAAIDSLEKLEKQLSLYRESPLAPYSDAWSNNS